MAVDSDLLRPFGNGSVHSDEMDIRLLKERVDLPMDVFIRGRSDSACYFCNRQCACNDFYFASISGDEDLTANRGGRLAVYYCDDDIRISILALFVTTPPGHATPG